MAYVDSVGNHYRSCLSGYKTNPGPKPSKGGNRKHGRKARKPSSKRYLSERRWEKNKERRRRKRDGGSSRVSD